jgi:hypothetical protein
MDELAKAIVEEKKNLKKKLNTGAGVLKQVGDVNNNNLQAMKKIEKTIKKVYMRNT